MDWDKIKAEYITGNMSYRQLSEKYNISQSTMTKRAAKEQWQRDKQNNRKEMVAKTVEKINEEKLDNVGSLLQATQTALIKVIELIDEGVMSDPRDVKQITSALKDIRDILLTGDEKNETV